MTNKYVYIFKKYKQVKNFMFWLLLIAIVFVILIVVYNSVPWAENKVLFYPSKKFHWKPDVSYQDVYIDIDNPNIVYNTRPKKECKRRYINGWHFNNYPGSNTVMYCHGNTLNISHRSYIVDICCQFELNLFIFDYRGFGKSSGKPSKRYVRKDGETAYKFLTQHCGIEGENIIIWGESLGGYCATWVASRFPSRSLILLCSFSGLDDAITYYFDSGLGQSLASLYSSMASMRYDIMPNRKYIKRVKCPVAIMHSKEDDIIPYECAKILYKNVSHDSKVLITIKGGHSSPLIDKEQLNKLFMFCDISLPFYDKSCDINGMLEELRTVAEKHHNFID